MPFRCTQKEQAQCKAEYAVKAAAAAKAAEEEEEEEEAAKAAEATAKAAQAAKQVKPAAPRKTTQAVKGKAVKSPVTPDITQSEIHPSPSPGSDDLEYETPKRKLNPCSLNYPSSGRSTPPVRARGRPCKEPQPPSDADKPMDGSKEELLCWKKRFNAASWHYKKLTSEDVKSYRESENTRVKERIRSQHQHIIDAASGSSDVYKHIPDTPKSIACEKSCQR